LEQAILNNQTPQEYFRVILFTVVGQAFGAAGYTLEERPMQWAGGRFRFVKTLEDGLYGFIEFQALTYVDSEWSSGQPSRFRITLIRGDSKHPQYLNRSLSALVVEDFGVAILPSADYWWTYSDTESLGKALAEAGHLVIGYGIPWLAGDLVPPSS
jgi:hypothetical protein